MILTYPGVWKLSKCKADVFGNVVIATQLNIYDDPGTSITNVIEAVAKEACNRFKIPYEKLILIEHYQDNECSTIFNHYKLVKMEVDEHDDEIFKNPDWQDISLEEVSNLIHENISEEKIENFISEDKKRLENYHNDRQKFLESICPHTHTFEDFYDKKQHCYLCNKIMK